MAKPFASKAQERWYFVHARKYAKGRAHATGMHSGLTRKLGYSPAFAALPAHSSRVNRPRHRKWVRGSYHRR
jgi:hypothetical protein